VSARASTPPSPLPASRIPITLRYFDCVLVLAFLPFALLAGLPVLGSVGGVVLWLVQRALGVALDAYAARQDDFRRQTGLTFAGGMLRPLLMGLTILALGGLGEREDGLTAALIVLVAFTIYMILSIIFRPQRKPSA
jgi:predicted lipid-binding transport protein (Tim44 family)